MRFGRLVIVSAAGLLAAACTSISVPGASPGTTLPPITIPSSLPSFEIPSGFTMPPIDIPTLEPGGATSGACALVSEAELTSVIGQQMTARNSSATQCTWTTATVLPTVVAHADGSQSIATGKLIASTNGRDLTIAGYPAYYGELVGSWMWIEKDGRTLAVQAIWSENGDAAVQKLSQIGTLAIGRF